MHIAFRFDVYRHFARGRFHAAINERMRLMRFTKSMRQIVLWVALFVFAMQGVMVTPPGPGGG